MQINIIREAEMPADAQPYYGKKRFVIHYTPLADANWSVFDRTEWEYVETTMDRWYAAYLARQYNKRHYR